MPSSTNEIYLGEFLNRLTALSVQIHNSTNLSEMLNVAVQQTREILGCDRVLIYQLLADEDGAITAESVGSPWTAILGELIHDPYFLKNGSSRYQGGEFIAIEDTQEGGVEECYANLLARMQVRASLAIPILVNQHLSKELFGLIVAHQCDRPRHWQAQEISCLQNIATHLGIAIQHISKFQSSNQASEERKQFEANLLESEARQRAIIEALPDLLLRVGRDGSCLNSVISSVNKTNQFVPICEHISEVLPEDLLQNQLKAIERAIATKELQVHKHQLLKFGKIAYEEVRVVALNDNEALVIVRDITEQIELENRLEQLSYNVPGVIYQYRLRPDGTSHFPYASQGMHDIYGVLPEDVKEDASPIFAHLYPEDIDLITQSIAESAEKLTLWQCEYRVCLPDGRTIWVSGQATPQREPDGGTLWHGYIGEITDQKESELELIESEQKLREAYLEKNILFSGLTDIVLIRDGEGRCLQIAPTNVDNLLGSPEEVLSESIYEELPEPAASIIVETIKKALATQQVVGCDYSLPIHGIDTWFAANISPIGDNKVIQISRDITERKQTEVALAKAKEAAEALTRAKSDFLANMSHEIRTPMNGVLGMAELLALTPLNEEQQDYVQTIHDSGDILLSVINDILDFSKIEAGKLKIEKRSFILEDAVKTIIQLLNNQSATQGTSLNYAIAPDVPPAIIGDAARLNQVLLNLVGNAIKFTKKGEVLLSISCLQTVQSISQPVPQLLFTVKDTGVGIPSDRIDLLFQPFAQADASISRKYGGTGLGLAICKYLVNFMGGAAWVESRGCLAGEPPLDWQVVTNADSKGSIFYFTITLLEDQLSAITEKDVTDNQNNALIAEQFPLKILIVEDNEVNQRIASLYLKKFGYIVDIANNGIEAIAMLSNQAYDLLFMDMQMPEMDGITATRLIRQNPTIQPQPKIVAMTANVMADDIQTCLDVGMDDYIGKPIRNEEIIRILTKF